MHFGNHSDASQGLIEEIFRSDADIETVMRYMDCLSTYILRVGSIEPIVVTN